jgi:formamidopyrimidine-DNA glycosylase
MPELPDVSLYIARLAERVVGQTVTGLKIYSPFVLRSTSVAPNELIGARVLSVSRLGKRIVLELKRDFYILVHLMIAGRFVWKEGLPELGKPSKVELFRILFSNGVLSLNEASHKKRAGLWLIRGADGLAEHRRAGLDVFEVSVEQFRERIKAENRTLKRTLTDPAAFDGIGNAFSDEILFAAKLSPMKLTKSLSDEEIDRLLNACRAVLGDWIAKLQHDVKGFPKPSQVTAFRKEFFVHGKFGDACKVCGAPIQRIVASENEMNYCARCQNDGKILADRSLSRLLKDDWPRSIDELMTE